MPGNHRIPHTEDAKAKMRAARLGKPAPWKHRPSKEIGGVKHYRCGHCGEFLPAEGFHKSNRTSLGIKSDCKKCHSAISIASRDPETTRAAGRRNESARRARKAGANGVVTADDWRRVISILGEGCLCCGSKEQPTQDHIIPLSKGGLHHPTNLQPLCRQCNERKQARTRDYRTSDQRAEIDSVWVIDFRRIAQ